MILSRIPQKVERVTVTLLPDKNEGFPFHIPTTFDAAARVYGWRHSARLDYLIIPTKISSTEVKIDVFVAPTKGGKLPSKDFRKQVHSFIEAKIASEWRGLRLGEISRPIVTAPPRKSYVRGTIEDMLGASFEH